MYTIIRHVQNLWNKRLPRLSDWLIEEGEEKVVITVGNLITYTIAAILFTFITSIKL